MQHLIEIYTDGSARGNPGPGGWAALIIYHPHEGVGAKVIELAGHEERTTNNRMELTAALRALETLKLRNIPGNVVMYTDSTYLLQGITGWVYAWEKNNWKTKSGEEVLNQDLWKALLATTYRQKLAREREISWQKVGGHAGVFGNERVDTLATSFADRNQTPLFTGSWEMYKTLHGGSPKRQKGDAYSYVSVVNGSVETHPTWKACEARVKGVPGARFKKALSALDEKKIIAAFSEAHAK